MPVTIQSPQGAGFPSNLVSWGSLVHASTDAIGPFPVDTIWRVEWWRNDFPEQFIARQEYPFIAGQPCVRFIGEPGNLTAAQSNQGFQAGMIPDLPMTVRVTLNTPSTGFVEQTSVIVAGDSSNRAVGNLFSVLSTQTGNFTEADRTTIQQTNQATIFNWGSGLLSPLTDLLLHPPMSAIHRELITPDRTGFGSLTPPPQPLVPNTFGITWEVISVPPGQGLEEGAPQSVIGKMLQLQIVHEDAAGHVFTSADQVFKFGDLYYFFEIAKPSFVNYWILPGITLRLFWLRRFT